MVENTNGGAPSSPDGTECQSLRDREGHRGRGRVPRGRRTRLAVLLALVLCVGSCKGCDDSPTDPEDLPGTLQGAVTVEGVPRAGVRITATRPDIVATRSQLTNANGQYSLSLVSVTWAVRAEPIEGAECPPQPDVKILSDQTVTRDFECTLIVGTMMGVVTLDGAPARGVTVQIVDQQSADVTSVVTDGEGAYLKSLVPGRYAAFVTISNATCASSPQTVDVVASEQVTGNVTCQTNPGTVRGQVTLGGAPAAGVSVRFAGDDWTGRRVDLGSVLTDADGRYVALMTPGVRDVYVYLDGTFCDGPEQVTVVSGQETVADIACFAIEGVYSGTFTETSNTCNIPLAPAFGSLLAVGFIQTVAEAFIDILPGDRPQETAASGPYDPATGVASLLSPPFEDSGITFQESWAIVFGLSDLGAPFDGTSDVSQSVVGVTFDGTVDVTLAVGGTVVCTRTYGVEATRTGS